MQHSKLMKTCFEKCLVLYLDYFCFYYSKLNHLCCSRKKKTRIPAYMTPSRYYHVYDLLNDIIRLEYYKNGQKYSLCIPRNESNNLYQLYFDIIGKNTESREMIDNLIMDATLNGDIDITDRINEYLGYKGCHLDKYELKIKWLLSVDELSTFKNLIILTNDFKELNYVNVDDSIVL